MRPLTAARKGPTYAGDVQALRALQAGARAYLLKNLLHKELLETIRAVHDGEKTMSPQVSYELAEHATGDALTKAENDVLRGVLRGWHRSLRLVNRRWRFRY